MSATKALRDLIAGLKAEREIVDAKIVALETAERLMGGAVVQPEIDIKRASSRGYRRDPEARDKTLAFVVENGNKATVKQLVRKFGITKVAAYSRLKTLQTEGLLKPNGVPGGFEAVS